MLAVAKVKLLFQRPWTEEYDEAEKKKIYSFLIKPHLNGQENPLSHSVLLRDDRKADAQR